MIILGISLLLPIIPIAFYFTNKTKRILVLISVIIICVTLIGIGTVSKYEYFKLQWSIVAIFFIASMVVTLFMSTHILINDSSISLFYAMFGYFTFLTQTFHCTKKWFFGKAYSQRIATLFTILFMLLISGRIILDKKIKKLKF
ncbi:MAG: hypothetical protein HZR80_08655 [Candidatus Heimdallarchaeota archaeon]